MTPKVLDVLMDACFENQRNYTMEAIAKCLGQKQEKEMTSWGGNKNSYLPRLREYYKKAPQAEKLQIYLELTLDKAEATTSNHQP